MKTITKNFLCLALTAALTVSLFPSSFAEEPTSTAQESAVTETADTGEGQQSQEPEKAEEFPEATESPEPSSDPESEDADSDKEDEAEDTDEEEDPEEEPEESVYCLCVIDEGSLPEGMAFASERQNNGFYPSLAAALAFAEDGDTVRVCQNTSVIYNKPITKCITLDMGGNSFTGTLICAATEITIKEGIISAGEVEVPDDSNTEESSGENEESGADPAESAGGVEESGAQTEEIDGGVIYAAVNQEGCSLKLENCVVIGPIYGSFALTSGTFTVKPDASQLASGYYIQESNDLYTVTHGISFTDMSGKQSYLVPAIEDGTLTVDYDGTLNLEDLEAYALNNGASSIVIHSKMAIEALQTEDLLTAEEKAENISSAEEASEGEFSESGSLESTAADDASSIVNPAPNTIIKGADGSVFFSAVAEGGSLKLNDTSSTEKATLRFQYSFIIPVQPEQLTWSWKIYYYNAEKGKNYSLTIHGVKYSVNDDGSYTSNAIITNIPASVYNTDLNAILTLSFVHNGFTYTVTQNLPGATSVTQSTPEARSVRSVAAHLYNNTQNDYTDYYYSLASR